MTGEKRAENAGYISVFLTLMTAALLVMFLAVLRITDTETGRSRTAAALGSAQSNELAKYQKMMFDRYDILVMDETCGGKGEGALEQSMEENLAGNLGSGFEVQSVALAGSVHLMEDDCEEFRKQIRDALPGILAEESAEQILDKTNGEDEAVSRDAVQKMENDIDAEKETRELEMMEEEEQENGSGENEAGNHEEAGQEGTAAKKKDPRKTLRKIRDRGISEMIRPDDAELSDFTAELSDLPSGGTGEDRESVHTDFEDDGDYEDMKLDVRKGDGWTEHLANMTEGMIYAGTKFNCLTEEKYSDTALNLELEYLVAGKATDAENYDRVVDELISMRFGFNFAYLISDAEKMAELDALSLTLSALFPFQQPVVKYLLAGCWSYFESIADVYWLVRGKSMPYWKTRDTWMTDLDSLGAPDRTEVKEDTEKGLNYKEYLFLLLSFHKDTFHLRMLDLMQMNVRQEDAEGGDPDFRIENAVTSFGTDVQISGNGTVYEIHEEAGY